MKTVLAGEQPIELLQTPTETELKAVQERLARVQWDYNCLSAIVSDYNSLPWYKKLLHLLRGWSI